MWCVQRSKACCHLPASGHLPLSVQWHRSIALVITDIASLPKLFAGQTLSDHHCGCHLSIDTTKGRRPPFAFRKRYPALDFPQNRPKCVTSTKRRQRVIRLLFRFCSVRSGHCIVPTQALLKRTCCLRHARARRRHADSFKLGNTGPPVIRTTTFLVTADRSQQGDRQSRRVHMSGGCTVTART